MGDPQSEKLVVGRLSPGANHSMSRMKSACQWEARNQSQRQESGGGELNGGMTMDEEWKGSHLQSL